MRSKNAVFSGSLMCLKTCTNEVCSAKQTRRTDVHLTACKDRFFFSISVFFRSEFSALEFISEEFKKKKIIYLIKLKQTTFVLRLKFEAVLFGNPRFRREFEHIRFEGPGAAYKA